MKCHLKNDRDDNRVGVIKSNKKYSFLVFINHFGNKLMVYITSESEKMNLYNGK